MGLVYATSRRDGQAEFTWVLTGWLNIKMVTAWTQLQPVNGHPSQY